MNSSPHSRRDMFRASPIGDALGLAPAPPHNDAMVTLGRKAMACDFQITIEMGDPSAMDAASHALDEVDALEELLTVYDSRSDLSRINLLGSSMPVPVDPQVIRVLELAHSIHSSTAGAFDVATGSLIKCWGFFQGPKRVPPNPELEQALRVSGSKFVQLDSINNSVRLSRDGVELNLGAIGKGFALDQAASVLREKGVRYGLLHGGQSSVTAIGCAPGHPWSVGITHPIQKHVRVGVIELNDCSLGTSGAAIQFFESGGRRFGHILDPRTGWPTSSRSCVSVLAPTAAEADALSTAFFVMGTQATREFVARRPEIGAVIVTPAGNAGKVHVEVLGRARGLVSTASES